MRDRDVDKPVPSDVEAETAVLGAILIDPETALPDVAGLLDPRDFYREKNAWIYEAMLAVYGRGEAVNELSVLHELDKSSRVAAVGGPAYTSQLVASPYSPAMAEDFAAYIKRAAFSRRLVQAGAQIAAVGYEDGESDAALGRAQEILLALGNPNSTGGLRSLKQVAEAHHDELEAWAEHPERLPGVSTGFRDLDATVGGFERGRMYVLAARPSMGKSATALAMALSVARSGQGVALFSLEMSELAVLMRMVLARAGVNRYAVRVGDAGGDWRAKFWSALGETVELPLWLDDTASITTGTARSRMARLKTRHPNLGLLVFDYANLAGDDPDREEYKRTSDITRRLQAMAKSLDVPVLALYQLNRQTEGRDEKSKRPVLADLRQTGVIEECADVVIMLYRPAYYAEMWNRQAELPKSQENLLELWVRKQRDGATGLVKLLFDKRTGAIGDWRELL